MEDNKNSDFETEINSAENNSNPRLGHSNFRPGSPNSNPRSGSSNSNSQPGLSNSNPRPSSANNHWLDRDSKIPKKRSHSDNDEWGRDNKLNKRGKEGNSGNEMPNENSNHILLMPFQDLDLASQRMAMAAMSQHSSMNAYPCMNMGNSDGSLYGMVPMMSIISSYTQFPVMNNIDPIVPNFNNLEPITIPHAVLTPPLERRSHRAKPPGCRTVFVGNLPEKITEEIIKEAFKICGPITVVRMSKKNFCHIRFVNMESADQALLLSGFRIRIDESDDPAYNGKLHVDYAVARDDLHDYECLERARLLEECHHQKEAFHPLSPPPIPDFSEHEAQTLAERLRNEKTFREGLQVLITWLDRGECNKRNSEIFYSLIQNSHSRVKRLRNEKSRYEEEAEKAKENLINKNRSVGQEINEIEKVFVAAKTQKVWDHFSRNQRKKIEEMKNDTYDLKQTNSEDLLENRVEDKMELSDNEENVDVLQVAPAEDLNILKEKLIA